MAKVGINVNEYFNEVAVAKASATNLTTKNGVAKPTKHLNVNSVHKLWNEYDNLTNTINEYAKLVEHDISRFHQAGKNKIELDKSYSKK
ncbi:hypothetical protein [Companilactobacillus sp. DQM5]|uniref:hypothetical protein n=1 Tax=Companilactobacillus sp. DQM5 TaxID=3463359 RepID=UPI004059480F